MDETERIGRGDGRMRRWILFRHGKAEPRGGDDVRRGLVERGRADVVLVAQSLAAAGLAPDLALVSSAERTRQTWDCARPYLAAGETRFVDDLYNAAAEDVEAELATAHEAKTILVVGHNPSLQDLAVGVLEAAAAPAADVEKVAAGFPTSAAAVLLIGDDGAARLEHLFVARDLRPRED